MAALLVSALLLGGPAMMLLAQLPVTRRTPVATLICWQLLAVASVESAVLASVAAAWSVWGVDQHRLLTAPLALGAALAGGYVVLALSVQGHRVGTRLRRIRRRQRELVDLTATVVDRPLRVLEIGEQLAYCVPGWRGSGRVVVSQGTRDRLDGDQLAAVVAHERAHLRWRHDLVVEAFTVLRAAAPSFVGAGSRALAEVSLLVEILADRAAAAQVGAAPLVRAMGVALEEPLVPQGLSSAEPSGSSLRARVEMLDARASWGARAAMSVTNAALLGWIIAMTLWTGAELAG